MCGFAGIITSGPHGRDGLGTAVERMAAAIAHRGPDDHGSWIDADLGVAFGFRRLSILDLSEHGHQPMESASGRFVMVFNGEVFNFEEIRAELNKSGPVAFRGHSDTEVILAAFERWGIEAAVQRFVGMFAIAVHDRHKGGVTLIRDRLGIKPLYIYAKDGLVLFGSELKALLAHPGFQRSLDRRALAAYFRYLYVPAPRTIFEHTTKLPPGSTLTIRDPREPLGEPRRYWSLMQVAQRGAAARGSIPDEEILPEFERRLRRAVELRMRSDVPVGALLSGGVDSATVTALMSEVVSKPVRTFCIGFDSAEHDEGTHAAAVARHLGTEHTEVRLSGKDALETLPRLVQIFDEPFANPSHIPTLLVCEVARRDVTVALSGDGGDEILAGYNRYLYGRQVIETAARYPRVVRRAASQGIGMLSARNWDRAYETVRAVLPRSARERLVGEKISKAGTLLGEADPPSMYRSLLSAWDRPEALVGGNGRLPDAVDEAFAAGLPDITSRMQLADQLAYLPDDLLAKVDRVSMAVSLEVRVPLIDHNVVEFSWSLPHEWKVRRGVSKWILRQLLYKRVPREIVDRPKTGFTVPLAAWLRGPLHDWAGDLLSPEALRTDTVLDGATVAAAWRDFRSGRDELALSVWSVLMYRAWREVWS